MISTNSNPPDSKTKLMELLPDVGLDVVIPNWLLGTQPNWEVMNGYST